MKQRTGTFSIADFDLVVDEIDLGSGMGVARIVRPAGRLTYLPHTSPPLFCIVT